MKINLTKTIHNELVPVFIDDMNAVKHMPINEMIEVEFNKNRKPESNSKMWAICNFFMEGGNIPEKFEGVFKNVTDLYEWLKIKVGFVKRIGVGNDVYMIPLHTNFSDLQNETEYIEKFQKPAIKFLADMLGWEVYDLMQISYEVRQKRNLRDKGV